ncbi:DUF1833 domain-containing protein [Alcanivorax sp. S6407]|uniref:DUF1833 family protein n=1 Tax=Alcanivorax sp. S6407 TaxID=2926424 RepID=UPI001FF40EA2|nr:DUF1833 family protein [Alcanivorax sp. S6407]MCK0153851.1 DUF1833 domain-containing protein [Alcanivorax sp. S6407]
MPTALDVIYASAPTGVVLIPTLDIRVPGEAPIRVCNGFEDIEVTLEDDSTVTFTAGNLVIDLPEKNDTGKQTLKFGLWNANGDAQAAVVAALEATTPTEIIYREFDSSDLSAPASLPQSFTLVGGSFEGVEVQLEASYYDILNTAWPRERYTQLNAPGIAYL